MLINKKTVWYSSIFYFIITYDYNDMNDVNQVLVNAYLILGISHDNNTTNKL